MALLTRDDALAYRNQPIRIATLYDILDKIQTPEQIKQSFLDCIDADRTSNRYQVELYLWSDMPDIAMDIFMDMLNEKYLSLFPGFEIVSELGDDGITAFAMRLNAS
jgi:hypothetical protein